MESEDWLKSSDPKRAAAAWCAKLEGPAVQEADRIGFADWLRESPVHLSEYLRVSAIDRQLRDPTAFEGLSVDELMARARNEGVVRLPFEPDLAAPVTSRSSSRRIVSLAAMAAGIALCLVGAWAWLNFHRSSVAMAYSTAVGEQRSIVLGDGSLVELNTRSTLEVNFDAELREIALAEGSEALFHVAHDTKRPFRVRSGDTLVQALGTEFTMRREGQRTTVAVLEGRVSVTSASRRVELGAGQGIAIASGIPADRAPLAEIDREAALAWSARRLVFDDLTLDAVAAEFNRYNAGQIHLESPELAGERITGVFDANDPGSFLEFLEGALPVEASMDGQGNVLIRPRGVRESEGHRAGSADPVP